MIKATIGTFLGLLMAVLMPTTVVMAGEFQGRENNKIGIHILSPDEVIEASKLVNGESGGWGYVTVPIQATDRNRDKWVKFMNEAREHQVIPIIRVATLVSNVHWEEPNNFDLVDFANFLNDLPWPTKNRYVIIFNEVNRADEFGGYVSPERYADTLANAVTIFKERSEEFFVIPAGLDNAAASNGSSLHWLEYWTRVVTKQPDILTRIDGWSSHAYPNPAFRGSPYDRHDRSVASYLHDLRFLSRYTARELPVFITETGWDMDAVSSLQAAEYFRQTYAELWNDNRVVAVTPFLLRAGAGPFTKFSFLDAGGQPKEPYLAWQSLATRGTPELSGVSEVGIKSGGTGVELQPASPPIQEKLGVIDWGEVWRWLGRVFGLYKVSIEPEAEVAVGEAIYQIEIADTDKERSDGLSGRNRLKVSEGMLFIFDEPYIGSFWMKGMKFDIEMVWIANGRVVQIDEASHKQPYKRYKPSEPAEMVLEVVTGSEIGVGDEVVLVDSLRDK